MNNDPELLPQAIDRALLEQELNKKSTQREAKRHIAESLSPYVSAPYYQKPSYGDMIKEQDFASHPDIEDPLESFAQPGATSVEIPNITPAFLGLRKRLTEIRINRNERQTERVVKQARSAAFVGRILERNRFMEGYLKDFDHPLLHSPKTVSERITAARLDRRSEKRFKHIAELKHYQNNFDDDEHRLGKAWHSNRLNKQEKVHNKLSRKPIDKVEKLMTKKQKLLAKREAIERARADKT